MTYDYKTACCIVIYNTGGYEPIPCRNAAKYYVLSSASRKTRLLSYCEEHHDRNSYRQITGEEVLLTNEEAAAAEILIA